MRSRDAVPWLPLVLVCAAAPAHATRYLTLEQAQRALFPQADAFSPVSIPGASAWAAKRAGVLQGHVLVDEVIGRHERITYALGVGADGAIRGVEIMDYREPRGGEVRDPRWLAQFVGKRQGAALRLDEDILNISGATLSCLHITQGVRRLLGLMASAQRTK